MSTELASCSHALSSASERLANAAISSTDTGPSCGAVPSTCRLTKPTATASTVSLAPQARIAVALADHAASRSTCTPQKMGSDMDERHASTSATEGQRGSRERGVGV